MLVVAYEIAFRVGAQRGFTRAREPEEDGHVALFAHVGAAVHGRHTAEREEVVHHAEDALLHLAAVPGAAYYGHFLY